MKKDIISKDIIKTLFKDILKYFANIDLENKNIEFLDKELKRIEKREADIVAKIDNSYIIHLEIQNQNDKKMHYRMLRYYVDIKEKTDLPITQYLIYIGKESPKFQTNIQTDDIIYKYNFIDIKTIDCDLLLSQNNPEALVLAILCDFKNKNPKDVVKYIISSLKKYKNNKKYFLMLEILSTNRSLEKIIEEEKMLNVDFRDLPSYKIGYKEAWNEAWNEAEHKAKIANAIIMIKEFNLPIESVADKLGIDKNEIIKELNK